MTRKTIDYGSLMHRAMRGLIRDVLLQVEREGLPGDHHFFITFDTTHPDTEIADWLSDRYPTDDEGLEILWNKEKMQDEEEAKKWRKLLEQPMPNDRFGNPWGYRQASENGDEDKYDLWSPGRDKQEGTADDIRSDK